MSTFASDNFAGVDGSLITAHADLLGNSWAYAPTTTGTAALTASNSVRANSTNVACIFLDSGTPTSADYSVYGTFKWVATITSNSDVYYLLGRASTSAATYYQFGAYGNTWSIWKYVNGSPSITFGSTYTQTVGTAYNLQLQLAGSTITGLVNGVQVVQLVDSSPIAGPGRAGAMITSGNAPSDTVGPQLSAFSAGSAGITITAPVPYQIVQQAGGLGSIAISGTNTDTAAHPIQASFNGGAWVTIAASVAGGATFTGTLAGQAAGGGVLTVRFGDSVTNTTAVNNIGIGDIFVIAGQSNAVGQGLVNQTSANTNLAAGFFSLAYGWGQLTDPVGSATNAADSVWTSGTLNAGGSVWPLVATQLMALLKYPVAFVPCAKDSTGLTYDSGSGKWLPIPASHVDRTTLYGATVYRAQLVGSRAILWWQGETDAGNATTQAAYFAALQSLVAAFQADLPGVPFVPCKLLNLGSFIPAANVATINAAIGQAWTGIAGVKPGPDLSDIVADSPPHITTSANLATAAARWAQAIYQALYAAPVGVPSIGSKFIH